jgi:hypothetical protein
LSYHTRGANWPWTVGWTPVRARWRVQLGTRSWQLLSLGLYPMLAFPKWYKRQVIIWCTKTQNQRTFFKAQSSGA